MLGHFGWPAAPVLPEAPVDALPEDGMVVVGVLVEVLVAAWAATPPPNTRAPDKATAAAVLLIARMLLTSLPSSLPSV